MIYLKIAQEKSEYLIVSDEAYFCLTESLNRQNNRIWDIERPTDVGEAFAFRGTFSFLRNFRH